MMTISRYNNKMAAAKKQIWIANVHYKRLIGGPEGLSHSIKVSNRHLAIALQTNRLQAKLD